MRRRSPINRSIALRRSAAASHCSTAWPIRASISSNDMETALRMWTENVTWFSNEEGKKGRIEVGQLADLIVPDRDYFSCPEDEIAGTTSELTVVGGKVVYGVGD